MKVAEMKKWAEGKSIEVLEAEKEYYNRKAKAAPSYSECVKFCRLADCLARIISKRSK